MNRKSLRLLTIYVLTLFYSLSLVQQNEDMLFGVRSEPFLQCLRFHCIYCMTELPTLVWVYDLQETRYIKQRVTSFIVKIAYNTVKTHSTKKHALYTNERHA